MLDPATAATRAPPAGPHAGVGVGADDMEFGRMAFSLGDEGGDVGLTGGGLRHAELQQMLQVRPRMAGRVGTGLNTCI